MRKGLRRIWRFLRRLDSLCAQEAVRAMDGLAARLRAFNASELPTTGEDVR